MSYSNNFLNDFVPIFKEILKEKRIAPEKLELEIIDEEPEENSIFEPAGVAEVLEQLAPSLNFLTIYTDRPAYFQGFAEIMYEENGLMVEIVSKKELQHFLPKKPIALHAGENSFGIANRSVKVGNKVVLDFEWNGSYYLSLLNQGKNYIPIHKKPWKIAENLDIIVPFGYNTVIVKDRHNENEKLRRDRFEEAFYRNE